MKNLIVYGMGFLLVFAGTVAGMLAATGNLNKGTVDKILKRDASQTAPVEEADPLDPLLAQVKEQLKDLEDRDKALDDREAKLQLREKNVSDLFDKTNDTFKQLQEAADTEDAARAARMKDAATTLAEMKAENAATVLSEYPDIQEAAEILRMIKEKDRGKILDAIKDTKQASLLLRTMLDGGV